MLRSQISDVCYCVCDLTKKKDYILFFSSEVCWKLMSCEELSDKETNLGIWRFSRSLEIFLSQQRKRELGFCIYNIMDILETYIDLEKK